MFKRDTTVCTCGTSVPCTDDGSSSLREMHQVEDDPSIKRYVFPTDAEMEEIITAAETYTGEWYHSQVTLDGMVEGSPRLTERTTSLRKRIKELGADAGIYISTRYDDPELDAVLNKMFADLHGDDE